MKKLHPRAIWIFFLRFLTPGFLFVLIIGWPFLGLFAKAPERSLFLLGWLLLILILYIIFCYGWARLTYKYWGYQLTEDVLRIEHGVIWKKYVSIPYERIQNIDIYRGVLVRILGLSEVQVQTAGLSATYHGGLGIMGGAGAEGRLPGIEKSKAEELREELIKRVKGTKSGL